MATRNDERDASTKDRANVAVSVAATAAGTALAVGAAPAVAVAVAGATAGAGTIASMIVGWQQRKRARRWESFLDEYYRCGSTAEPADAEAELHAHGDEPLVQELVIEGARAIDEALADVVVPVMARLTRQYVASGRSADWFFRGTRRLLSDLAADEYTALRSMIERVVALSIDDGVDTVRLEHHEKHPSTPDGLTCNWVRPAPDANGRRDWVGRRELGLLPFATRLFHVLKTNGLGEDAATGGFTATGGPCVIYLQRGAIIRLWNLVR